MTEDIAGFVNNHRCMCRWLLNQNEAPEMIDVGADNVDKAGFFCFMSKKKSGGKS